jgi:hypothetical protein
MGHADLKAKSEVLIGAVYRACHLSTNEARSVVASLIGQTNGLTSFHNHSKVYIFNRVYCNVPESEVVGKIWPFGGWGIESSSSKGHMNILYPLKTNSSGVFYITVPSPPYGGPAFQGLNEFDEFLKLYGKRKL